MDFDVVNPKTIHQTNAWNKHWESKSKPERAACCGNYIVLGEVGK